MRGMGMTKSPLVVEGQAVPFFRGNAVGGNMPFSRM